ncbi:MAG: hypothetical protein KDB39_02730, partial [Austwickia sp.]|nr:hypothetical protein [Austwickia sp.]
MADSTAATADPELDRVAAPRRRLAAAIVVPAVVVLGAGGIAWADLAPAPPVGGAAARYLPADGSAQLQLDADGGADVVESTRAVGPTLLLELPALAADHVWGQFDDDEVAGLRLWRRTVTPLDSEVPPDAGAEPDDTPAPDAQVSMLARLGPEGVGLLATTGTASGLSFSPALPVLPADVVPGSHWEGEGEALPQGFATYRVEGSAAAADAVGEGCLTVTLELELVPRDGDPVTATQTDTWCPGRGVVASRATGPD